MTTSCNYADIVDVSVGRKEFAGFDERNDEIAAEMREGDLVGSSVGKLDQV